MQLSCKYFLGFNVFLPAGLFLVSMEAVTCGAKTIAELPLGG
jgi:hypothetical protein